MYLEEMCIFFYGGFSAVRLANQPICAFEKNRKKVPWSQGLDIWLSLSADDLQ